MAEHDAAFSSKDMPGGVSRTTMRLGVALCAARPGVAYSSKDMVRRDAAYSDEDMAGCDAACYGKGILGAVPRVAMWPSAMRRTTMRWLYMVLLSYLGSFSVGSSVGYFFRYSSWDVSLAGSTTQCGQPR